MGKIYEAGIASATLRLDGFEPQTVKVFRRMRRGTVIKDGDILPGPKGSRYSVPFESNLEVAVWVYNSPGRTFIKAFTTRNLYEEARATIAFS